MASTRSIVSSIRKRLGYLPPFFEPALQTPAVLETLWSQWRSLWLANPLPERFKEKILTLLARHGSSPYGVIAHACAMHFLGLSGAEVAKLLEMPFPGPPTPEEAAGLADLPAFDAGLERLDGPPAAEAGLLRAVDWLFLYPLEAAEVRAQLARLLGPERFLHLLPLLTFATVRNAWEEAHPDLPWRDDFSVRRSLPSLLEEEPLLLGKITRAGAREGAGPSPCDPSSHLLVESEARFHLLIESAPIGIGLARGDLLLHANAACLRLFGYAELSELAGRPVLERVSPKDRAAMAAWVTGREQGEAVPRERETRCLRRDGTEFAARIVLEPIVLPEGRAMVAFFSDLTESKALEEQLGQARRMESIGQLAGGIAHDFNNLLTIIQGHCQFLLESSRGPEPDRDCAQEIALAAERGSNLTRQLLKFSRLEPVALVPVALNEVILETLKMMGRVLREDIRLDTRLAGNLPPILADRALLQHVLINLIVNARDALPGGGVISIASDAVSITRENRKNPEAYEGHFGRIRLADTGSGIRSEHLPRIYEPFFSTKKEEHGTGLGLATARRAVQQHKGWIDVSSKLGEGTVFEVFIPFTEAPLSRQAGNVSSEPVSGEETILLVEDEASLRRLLGLALRKQRYHVLEANLPGEAHEVWQANQSQISLLITDIVMPGGQTGWDLAKRFLRDQPDLKVLFMSGYFGDLPAELDVTEENFIRKPFLPRELLTRVRSLLDNR